MSLEQKIYTIQALALQSLTGKVDAVNPIMEGSVVFNPASGDNNTFTNNIQSQFNQNVFINRNLTVSSTTFLKSKQVVYDVGTMLSNLNVFGDVVIKNGSLIDQEGTAYFDNISVATNLIARGGIADFKAVNISSLTIQHAINMNAGTARLNNITGKTLDSTDNLTVNGDVYFSNTSLGSYLEINKFSTTINSTIDNVNNTFTTFL